MDLAEILNIVDWVGVALTLVSVILIFNIGKMTRWFKAWTIIFCAFALILIRRALVAYAPVSGIQTQIGQLNQVIQLVISILYVIGFYLLYMLFKKQSEKKKN